LKEEPQYSDLDLVRQLKANDMTGFDMLYRKYSQRIYQFSFSILKSQVDAEEIVQDVFFKVWEKRDTIQEHLSFQSYLFTIAHNTSLSLIRKKLKETRYVTYLKSTQIPVSDSPVSDELEFSELKKKAQDAINHLSTRQKQIYLLSREDGFSYREISEQLNISVNTVENHMVKALKFLRESLGRSSMMALLFYYLFL
jgi:RNA polymerase sigma-70 factor (ECF subfamily)